MKSETSPANTSPNCAGRGPSLSAIGFVFIKDPHSIECAQAEADFAVFAGLNLTVDSSQGRFAVG